MVVSVKIVMEAIVGPVITAFSGIIVDRVWDVVFSFVLASGFALVSAVVIADTMLVVVTTEGSKVTTFVSLLVLVAVTDVMV